MTIPGISEGKSNKFCILMKHDLCEKTGASHVQHGPHSNRIYLIKLGKQDLPEIVEQLDILARKHGYTKLFAKVPECSKTPFLNAGYKEEARIPLFYNKEKDACFLAKYLDRSRSELANRDEITKILDLAKSKAEKKKESPISINSTLIRCGTEHIAQMVEIYRKVFPSYPFPIHDPEYIRKTMGENLIYFGILENDKLIALSSAEMDQDGANAEMTDFATLPEQRGKGLAGILLREMEEEMQRLGIQTAYTMARAISAGMNIIFSQNDYQFAGTLINNTQISGSIESMNVWYKYL